MLQLITSIEFIKNIRWLMVIYNINFDIILNLLMITLYRIEFVYI